MKIRNFTPTPTSTPPQNFGEKMSAGFLVFLRRKDILSENVSLQLAKAAKTGDLELRNDLVMGNLQVVRSIAKRYRRTGQLKRPDLEQEGVFGLIKAAEKLDPRRGNYLTCAAWRVRQAMNLALLDQSRTIRIPQDVLTALSKFRRAERNLTQKLSRQPTDAELAELLEFNEKKVSELRITNAMEPVSLDHSAVDDDEAQCLLKRLKSESSAFAADSFKSAELRIPLAEAMKELTPYQREVLILHCVEEYTLKEIAKMRGCKYQAVQQAVNLALKKLRANGKLRGYADA